MTIHAAKGLEFPITIVSGMSHGAAAAGAAAAEVAFPPAGGVGYRFGRNVADRGVRASWMPIDEQMGFDERIRLLYVACTRAATTSSCRCTARSARRRPSREQAHQRRAARRRHGRAARRRCPTPSTSERDAVAGAARPAPPEPLAAVRRVGGRARRRARRAARRPTAVAATALTDEGAPDPGDELDRRAAEAAARPRPAAVAEGPLRHRRRPGRARRAADDRPRDRRRARRRGRRAVRGRGDPRPGRPGRAGSSATRSARPSVRRGRRRAALAGGLRLHPGRAAGCSRATSTCSTAAPTGSSSSTTRPRPPNDPAELDRRVEGYRLQGASYALDGRGDHRRAGRPGHVPVPHAQRPGRARAAGPRAPRWTTSGASSPPAPSSPSTSSKRSGNGSHMTCTD